jgi:glycerol-3-phosphate dehydrogenase
VWADEVRALEDGTNPDSIRPAKGIHITVPWEKVRNDIAVVIPVRKDKRSLFVVPWGPEARRHVRAHLHRHDGHGLRRVA